MRLNKLVSLLDSEGTEIDRRLIPLDPSNMVKDGKEELEQVTVA